MGLFDFFKKKATEEQPQTEEQQEGVLELDGVEVETDAPGCGYCSGCGGWSGYELCCPCSDG